MENSSNSNGTMDDFKPPNAKSRCTWSLGTDKPDPHRHLKSSRPKLGSSILSYIGDTPLVKLNRIPGQYKVKCQVFAKCEFLNPGGSVKDRIALRMIEEAEAKGIIEPGYTLIEPTSGNTGIGLAMAASVKGYRCIIVMPEKMSAEKANVLRALGAEIIRTPTSARFDSPDSLISVAQKLAKSIPRAVVLDQYVNPGNPLAHYDTTAEEILDATNRKLDMIVIGAGTGGTIAGIGRKIKEVLPDCEIVAADPKGSSLALPEELNQNGPNFYEVEGIGYDFIPTVLDRAVVDRWIKTSDKESLIMARELISKEGLLCGGSSGSAMSAAMEAAKDLAEDQTCVVILPDNVRNYLTKFIDDNWMAERGFLTETLIKAQEQEKPWFWDLKIDSLSVGVGLITITSEARISEAISTMKNRGIDQMPVVDDNGFLRGMITVAHTMKMLVGGSVTVDDAVETIKMHVFPTIDRNDTLGALTTLLKTQSYVVIVDQMSSTERKVAGIITHVDMLNYMIIADAYEQ
ncbi:cystathionine beta-synthase [Brevipalpus obovatus]|uniref:cystathionine beta-synthase n=1 Tax=Brevipalpus obovatus TaxID=246614 RepID=UPI003D9E68A4